MLVVSLLLMGIATVGVGLLPTYTQIGLGAPVLLVLLRLLQGLSAGGEWGGAALMAVEHAPRHRRGLFGAFPQLGAPAGLVLANAVFFLVTFSTTDDQFAAWGWRLPFLFSAVMIAIGFFIRARVSESPEFTRLKDARERAKSPLSEVLREHRGPFLIAAGVFIANNMVGYIFLAYILGYATAELDVGQDAMLLVVVTGALSWVGTTLLAARWSDAVGRRRVYLVGSLWIIGWAFPFFLLLDTGSIPVMLPSVLMLSVGLGLTYGPQAALYAELFPSRVRYSGASFSYAIGAVLGGGFAPFVAASLQASTGTSMSVSAYMAAVGLVSLVAVLYIPETPDQVRERRAAGGTVTR